MILAVNIKDQKVEKESGHRLKDFGLNESNLQEYLFKTLDRLIPDDELITLMQSRKGKEEPDIMAIGENGDLFIFELKAWESTSENLLQVLRYGQIFGPSSYTDLDKLYKNHTDRTQSLSLAYEAKFGETLSETKYNQKQIFIVMTNGLDYKTRISIQYWRSCGLDVRPWIYRIYKGVRDEEISNQQMK